MNLQEQKFLWQLSLVLSHTIWWEERERNRGVEAFNVSGGGSSGSQDTAFARTGTSRSSRSTTLPSFLSDLLTKNTKDASVPANLSAAQDSFLTKLISSDPSAMPGRSVLDTQMAIDPESYTGKGTLTSLATRDPFSTSYEANTEAKYQDLVDQGLARVQSGPDNVRGGQDRVALTKGEAINRMALDRADEIRRAQLQDAGLATNASQIMAAIEQGRRAIITGAQDNLVKQFLGGQAQNIEAARTVDNRRGVNAGNLALAARELGVDNAITTDDLKGKGTQGSSGSHMEGGVQCCFIFLEALNGQLPWYVRRGRDIFQTTKRRTGYIRMSRWLVPLMSRHSIVKSFVNLLLIKPFLKQGAWFFGDEKAKPCWRFYSPYCQFWFNLWSLLGRS